MVIIGVPARHLSSFAAVVAHEFAHLASLRLGERQPSFLAEGFACYAASLIGADNRPMGLPPHYHTAWLLSAGLQVSLEELWERADYTPELYDLAWSFALFVAARFGKAAYFDFYRQPGDPRRRAAACLAMPLPQLEREWHAFARSRVTIPAENISRMRRWTGVQCGRSAWLASNR
jgi:hypothetical protein